MPAESKGALLPGRTLAVVVGASQWPLYPEFEATASFSRSAHDLTDYLSGTHGLGLPTENVHLDFDSPDEAPQIMRRIRLFLRERRKALKAHATPATDLIFYYVGHGGFGVGDNFFLSIRATDEDDPLATSITAASLGRLIQEEASGLRSYLLLDCCFAASVTRVFMAGGPLGVAGVRLKDALPPQGDVAGDLGGQPQFGVAILCASGPRDPAIAPKSLLHTMFTGSLLEVLQRGAVDAPAWLTLNDVQRLVREHLVAVFRDRAVIRRRS